MILRKTLYVDIKRPSITFFMYRQSATASLANLAKRDCLIISIYPIALLRPIGLDDVSWLLTFKPTE